MNKPAHFIKASDFVRRQTPESSYSHFEGTWEELEKLCATNVRLGLIRAGYRDGVVLVDLEPDRFMSSVVSLKEGFADGTITRLKATYEARQEGEEPVLKITAYGKKQRAKKVFAVLYRWDVLEEGNERSQDSEWEIISINASPTEEETPMGTTARARNILTETGGTDPELEKKSKEELIEFIRSGAAASMFWARHTMVQPESEYVDEELERYKQWVDDLQAGMYINCVYCGHRYGPDDEVPASMADVLKEHVANCPKHPMSQLKKALEPFAKMHREGGNPMEIACTRGTGHEATHVFSRDFEAAAKALEGTWDMAGKLEGRFLGIEEFARDHCGYKGIEAKGPEGILYEYVEELEHNNVNFQDFACAVSDAVWGGELGWAQDDGLDKLADAVRNLVREKGLCTVVDNFDGNVVRQARFNALVAELERAKRIIGKYQDAIVEAYCTARRYLKPPTQLALTRQEELEKGLERVSEICKDHGATEPAIALRDWQRLLELLKELTYESQQPGSCRLTVKIPYFSACEIMDYHKSIPETSGLQDIERDFEHERLVLKFKSPEDRKAFEVLHELKIDKAT